MTSYYYCIDPVLTQAEAGDHENALITVGREPCPCNGHVDDCFVLANPVHIMQLNEISAIDDLAQLMRDVPLYHFNMELVLDEALAARHRNKVIMEALVNAFDGAPLPHTIEAADSSGEKLSGNTSVILHELDAFKGGRILRLLETQFSPEILDPVVRFLFHPFFQACENDVDLPGTVLIEG